MNAEVITGEYQGSFQKRRSTIDQIFTMRQILETCWKQNIGLYEPFIDTWAAYKLGPPPKYLVNLCSIKNNEMYAKLKIGKHLFSEFKCNKVLRQGDAVACLLLNVVLESEIRRSTVETWGAMFDKFSQIMV